MLSNFYDVSLKRSYQKYIGFFRELSAIGLLRFVRRSRSQVGLFFVAKKPDADGIVRLRMIVDARPTNLALEDPPGVCVCTP